MEESHSREEPATTHSIKQLSVNRSTDSNINSNINSNSNNRPTVLPPLQTESSTSKHVTSSVSLLTQTVGSAARLTPLSPSFLTTPYSPSQSALYSRSPSGTSTPSFHSSAASTPVPSMQPLRVSLNCHAGRLVSHAREELIRYRRSITPNAPLKSCSVKRHRHLKENDECSSDEDKCDSKDGSKHKRKNKSKGKTEGSGEKKENDEESCRDTNSEAESDTSRSEHSRQLSRDLSINLIDAPSSPALPELTVEDFLPADVIQRRREIRSKMQALLRSIDAPPPVDAFLPFADLHPPPIVPVPFRSNYSRLQQERQEKKLRDRAMRRSISVTPTLSDGKSNPRKFEHFPPAPIRLPPINNCQDI